jgi:hypothetical protein
VVEFQFGSGVVSKPREGLLPRNGKQYFFKFYGAETALKIIESSSLQWSSPLSFNDPFDTQTGLIGKVDVGQFSDRFVNSLRSIVFDEELPKYFNRKNRLHAAVEALRLNRDRTSAAEILDGLAAGAREAGEGLEDHFRKFSDTLRDNISNAWVFCLTDTIDNVVMWSHYADHHRGVAFKLICVKEIDHPFLIAKKMEYVDCYPQAGNDFELADHFSGVSEIDMANMAWRIAYAKHRDWSYEREWRSYIPKLDQRNKDQTLLIPQDSRVFGEIYLGCRMDPQIRDSVIKACRKFLPRMRIFDSRRSREAFSLEFNEI